MLETIQRVILSATRSSLEQTLPVFVPLLAFGWLIHFCSSLLEKSAVKLLGFKAYLYLIGWSGTLAHELGHILFCPLFGHKITGVRLFSLNSKSKNTGFVSHSFNSRNPYHLAGNFFISIGPLILGSILIYLILRYLAGLPLFLDDTFLKSKSVGVSSGVFTWSGLFFNSFKSIFLQMFRSINLSDYKLYLAGYLVLSIGSSMTLSREDLSAASGGLGVILLFIFAVNLVLAASGIRSPSFDPLVPWAAAACVLLMIIFFLCALAALLFWCLSKITGR